jgi:FkbM family methyltransferase
MFFYILRIFGHQKWLSFGIRNRVIRFFVSPDKLINKKFKINFFGNIYPGNLNSYIDWNVYFFGAYEHETLKLFEYILSKINCRTVLDIGANVGHHSLFISGFAKQVICLEPFPIFFKLIEEKISINCIENIVAYNIGLSNKNEELLYYSPSENQSNKGTGSFIKDYNTGISPSIMLMLTSGDEFVKDYKIEDIDFIKIDVEGFEKEVLEGISMLINKNSPIIFMEFSAITALKVGSFENLKIMFHNNYKFYYANNLNAKKELLNFENIGPDIIAIPSKFNKIF